MSESQELGALPVAVRTLGCKVNRAESEAIATALLSTGVRIAEDDDAAVIVINTCTVTGEADAKARKAVRHALASAGEPVVVVTGCLAALDRDGLLALGERVVVEADKERVAALVGALLRECRRDGADLRPAPAENAGGAPSATSEPLAAPTPRPSSAFRTRVAMKIEDGCDAFCSYCIVPYARGVPRATPLSALVEQARALVSAGTREIVLTGINIGRYNDDGADLADVLAALAQTGVPRVRLSSVEPLDLTPRLLDVMAATPAFCSHLHVPLQAGSDAVLAQMGRGYTTAQFAQRLQDARAALPGLVVTTDVLAGFPGETAEQAAETLAFCEQRGFGKLHVFRYSRRPGTPAAARDDQVADAEKAARAAALRELSARQVVAHALSRLGQVADVLVERVVSAPDGTLVAEGTTRDYLRVRILDTHAQEGALIPVELMSVEGERVLGRHAR